LTNQFSKVIGIKRMEIIFSVGMQVELRNVLKDMFVGKTEVTSKLVLHFIFFIKKID